MNSAKTTSIICILLMSIFLSPKTLNAIDLRGDWDGNIDFTVGQKYLDSDYWGSIDKQIQFGANYYLKPTNFPIGFNVSSLLSFGSETENEVKTSGYTFEQHFGLITIFNKNNFKFVFNGGIAFILADFSRTGSSNDFSNYGEGTGFYIDSEIQYVITNKLHAGMRIGYSAAKVDFIFGDEEAGGMYVGLSFGLNF
ncbi:MAG: hypothetical protein COA79_17635 [Planctomycetota bacterium]|nr:MAG: hypothetical protein COA79_17635 [Planctomycetota bacterium]